MLQVVLGAEKRKERQAPGGRTAAVQENRARLAEVQQGERQDGATVGQPRALPENCALPRRNKVPPRVTLGRYRSLA